MRINVAVDDSVDNGRAESAADSTSGEGKTGGGGKEGMWSGELNAGYQQCQRSRLANTGEHVDADLGVVPRRCDARVADCDDQEECEGGDKRGLHVFEEGGVERDGDGDDERREAVGELADGDIPGVVLKAEIEN